MYAEILIEHHTQKGNIGALKKMGEDIDKLIRSFQEQSMTLILQNKDDKEVQIHISSAEEIYLKVHAAISKIS